jgi:hypothetical protein
MTTYVISSRGTKFIRLLVSLQPLQESLAVIMRGGCAAQWMPEG